jgi:hypothetical protein
MASNRKVGRTPSQTRKPRQNEKGAYLCGG